MDYHNKRVAFLVHSYMLCIHSLLRLIEESCYDSYCISCNLQISHYTPFAGKILNYSELSKRIRDKFSYCLGTATNRTMFFSPVIVSDLFCLPEFSSHCLAVLHD